MPPANSDWIWSHTHNDYFRVIYDAQGQPICHFSKSLQTITPAQTVQSNSTFGNPHIVIYPLGSHLPQARYQYPSSPGTESAYAATQPFQLGSYQQPAAQLPVQNGHYPQPVVQPTQLVHSYQQSTAQPTVQNGYYQRPVVQRTHRVGSYQQLAAHLLPQTNSVSTPSFRIEHNSDVTDPHVAAESMPETLQYMRSTGRITSQIQGNLDPRYQAVKNPQGYFKKGRVFMMLHSEPDGNFENWENGPSVMLKIRRFVVVRPRAHFSLCLSINTYRRRATTKPGVKVGDHAAVVAEGGRVILHPEERSLQKSPMFIKVEDKSTGPIDPMSRMDFGKVFTIEHNVRVRNVGRILPDSLWRMDIYFAETLGIDQHANLRPDASR